MRCDQRKLLELLQSGEQETDPGLLAHVDHCGDCQSRLSRLAGDEHSWREAAAALQEGVADDPWPQGDASSVVVMVDPSLADDLPAACEPLSLDFLEQPRHPEMLGRLGRYEIEGVIGAGGHGVVLKGHDTELNRPVAIKVLAPHLAGSGAARARFAREARAAAAIVHDHVAPIHNVESGGKLPYLVMPYIPGRSLQARLDDEGPLAVKDILRIALQTAAGLAAAHEQGIIHRDVKPANILLEDEVDRVLISDFGLARTVDDASLTRSGIIAGTPQYMSPEQTRGEAVDSRSDLFSLGSVMYAMATGRPPFRADTTMGVLRKISDSLPRPIDELNEEIPLWLAWIVNRLLAKNPNDRFGSARELAQLMEQCLAHLHRPAAHPLPPLLQRAIRQATRSKRRRRLWQVTAAAAACVLAAALGTAAAVQWSAGPAAESNKISASVPAEQGTEDAADNASASASDSWNDGIDATLSELEYETGQLEREMETLLIDEAAAAAGQATDDSDGQ